MKQALSHFFLGSAPARPVVRFRKLLGLWTIFYWAPRLPHATEIYARPFLRRVGPLGQALGSPLPPGWLVTSVMVLLVLAAGGVVWSQRPRRYHLVVIACLIFLHSLDTMMGRAYGAIGFIAWLLLFMAPYEEVLDEDGSIRPGPVTAQRLLGLLWSSVYLFTAAAKILEANRWNSGRAIWRAFHGQAYGDWLVSHWVDVPLWACQVGAWGTVIAEVFLAIGIWFPRTRRSAMVVCVLLHLTMTLNLRVSALFPTLMLMHLVLFIPDE